MRHFLALSSSLCSCFHLSCFHLSSRVLLHAFFRLATKQQVSDTFFICLLSITFLLPATSVALFECAPSPHLKGYNRRRLRRRKPLFYLRPLQNEELVVLKRTAEARALRERERAAAAAERVRF